MPSLREAATQALEALEGGADSWQRVGPAIDALKSALAEPVQEQPICDECGKSKSDGWALYCVKCVEPMFASKAEPVQEPVCDKDPRGCYSVRCQLGKICKNAAPPQRKPLPASEIVTMYDESPTGDSDMIDFARAIERAHGIGDNT